MEGIKELSELLDAIDALIVDGIKAGKDGIDFTDITVLTRNWDKIKLGLEGVSKVPDELKDMDWNEGSAILLKLIQMVKNIKEAAS